MDTQAYLLTQKQLLETLSAKIGHLKSILADPNGTANDYDFAFVEFYSSLNDVTEFSISTPGFTALTDFSSNSLMANLCMRTARTFKAPFAYLGFGGSSLSMLMMIGKILPGWVESHLRRSLVLVDPLCHQSVLGGLDIARWQAVKLHREYISSLGVAKPITLETIQAAVKANGSHKIAALVYNPISYDGFRNREEERRIFAFCSQRNIKVIGDFAWSPFYGFDGYGKTSGSLIDHCHVSITSPHKKGLFPSPVSVILYRDEALQEKFIEAGRLGWATTSPSYGTLMLVDFRLALIETGVVSKRLSEIASLSESLRQQIGQLSDDLKVVDPADIGADYQDPAHILFSSHQSGLDCRKLSQWLGRNAHLDLEKSTRQTALFLVTATHNPLRDQIVSHFAAACSALEFKGDKE